MKEREVYPNAPLRLVTAEFRFPLSPRLAAADVLTQLGEVLGGDLPIIEPAALQLPIAGPTVVPGAPVSPGYRLLTRERTTAVTVSPNRVLVETTVYRHWADFCDSWVRLALAAIGGRLNAISGLERVGLRFINEIRTSLPRGDIAGWRRYLNAGLLAPMELAGDQAIKTVQLALHLDEGDGAELLMRAGLLDGRVVDDSGPLRLPKPVEDGRFFMVDIDSFWNRPATYEEWSVDHAIAIADRLHNPVDDLFERCITEELRADVLRRQL